MATLVFHLLDEVSISSLCFNPNPFAIRLLEQYPEKIVWEWISENKGAIHLLEKNLKKIDWGRLSANPNGIHLLEQYPEKIDWMRLSANPNGIHLLEQHREKIDWSVLCSNPNALHILQTLDYEKTKESNSEFKAELLERIFDPDRMIRFAKDMNMPLRDYLEFYRVL